VAAANQAGSELVVAGHWLCRSDGASVTKLVPVSARHDCGNYCFMLSTRSRQPVFLLRTTLQLCQGTAPGPWLTFSRQQLSRPPSNKAHIEGHRAVWLLMTDG
jgi:hypothetical protein